MLSVIKSLHEKDFLHLPVSGCRHERRGAGIWKNIHWSPLRLQKTTHAYVSTSASERKIPAQYQQRPQLPPFQPSVNISFGYSYPNLDYTHFANFYNMYKGNVSNQTGPFTGAIDYQFSRYMSIGVLGTYGKVTQPYYAMDNTTGIPDLTGNYENWSLMLNVVSYFPTHTRAVSPYLRTAVGVNHWIQDYTDVTGAKTIGIPEPSTLAYQASLGAKFNLSPRAGIFMEAGYGKYIVNGGLALKFLDSLVNGEW